MVYYCFTHIIFFLCCIVRPTMSTECGCLLCFLIGWSIDLSVVFASLTSMKRTNWLLDRWLILISIIEAWYHFIVDVVKEHLVACGDFWPRFFCRTSEKSQIRILRIRIRFPAQWLKHHMVVVCCLVSSAFRLKLPNPKCGMFRCFIILLPAVSQWLKHIAEVKYLWVYDYDHFNPKWENSKIWYPLVI